MTTEAHMNEQSPIRGRWTIDLAPDDGRVLGMREGHGLIENGRSVEVVPVLDEQAIERGEHEYDRAVARGEDHHKAFRLGLAAALEPE
jgi:hypothetical protein